MKIWVLQGARLSGKVSARPQGALDPDNVESAASSSAWSGSTAPSNKVAHAVSGKADQAEAAQQSSIPTSMHWTDLPQQQLFKSADTVKKVGPRLLQF